MSHQLSVILAAHNPHRGRLARVLSALKAQTLDASAWELLVIDNASVPALMASEFPETLPSNARFIAEPQLGLTAARRCGFSATSSSRFVLVDDDNVLHPDYLEHALALFTAHPHVGAFGGRSEPVFDAPPAPWTRQFDGLIACRDLGAQPQISAASPQGPLHYPEFAPIGAGMCIRRESLAPWLARDETTITDRKGRDLSSGGDNDIVLTMLRHGWQVAYFPQLVLEHLIPVERSTPAYLARLNRSISKSWMEVLARHDANPFPPIAPWTVPLRQARAWFTYKAWRNDAAAVRWSGACGHFEGRARKGDRHVQG